ncbi:MAG: SRPBCC family protein [Polyangia bacterium]
MIAVLLVALAAPANLPAIDLHDLQGSDGHWTEGIALVPAPRALVHEWLTDYARWVGRFPDMASAHYLGDDERGRHIVRFHSYLANRTFTIHEAVAPDLLVFDGWAPNVHTQGRIWILDNGDGRTRVVMQQTNEVHGFIGLFATRSYRRRAAFAATASHLRALLVLAASR